MTRLPKPTTVTEYINTAPVEAQKKLREIRTILKAVAPSYAGHLNWHHSYFEKTRKSKR